MGSGGENDDDDGGQHDRQVQRVGDSQEPQSSSWKDPLEVEGKGQGMRSSPTYPHLPPDKGTMVAM